MTPSQAIDAYEQLESALFVNVADNEEEREKNGKDIEEAFRILLADAKFEADISMLDSQSAKTYVFSHIRYWLTSIQSRVYIECLQYLSSVSYSVIQHPRCTLSPMHRAPGRLCWYCFSTQVPARLDWQRS